MKEIQVKYQSNYFKDDRCKPLSLTEKGDWCDLYCVENISISAGDFQLANLGVSMKLPEGYEAILAPRSSTFNKWGVLQTNGVGIIDSSYCGDDDIWKMPIYATRDIVIPRGTRLCQFRIQKTQPKINFVPVVHLEGENRSGFGSTGL